MVFRTLTLISATVLLLGCGLDGPPPSDKPQAANNSPTALTTAARTAVPKEAPTALPVANTANTATTSSDAANTPSWSPDPGLVDKLGRPELEQVRGVYHLRPPAGWKFGKDLAGRKWSIRLISPGHEWAGPVISGQWSAPGAECRVSLSIKEATTGGELTDLPLDENLATNEASSWGTVKKESFEQGRMGGLDFARLRCTISPYRVDPRSTGKELRYVFYFAKDGNRLINLWASAPVTGSDAEFQLAESSILSFTK
jgi:hypothetical protein